jgi:hypothetical protein
MAKKRKTRKEKIILQLKRELAKERKKTISSNRKIEARQGAISTQTKKQPKKPSQEKKTDISIFSYDPRLIKKDLLKTAFLAAIALSLEFVLYLKLR